MSIPEMYLELEGEMLVDQLLHCMLMLLHGQALQNVRSL
jgi:hypothetical protein